MSVNDIERLHGKLMKNEEYRVEYEATRESFNLQRALIKSRQEANLTQAELAARIGTRQSNISRIESGMCIPDLATLSAYAKGCGKQLKIELK